MSWAQHLALTSPPPAPPLPLQALEEALNVQASPPPIFASTMEPAGKVPQQELLTQNELLKQQVGQDMELLEAGRERYVPWTSLAKSLLRLGAAQQS